MICTGCSYSETPVTPVPPVQGTGGCMGTVMRCSLCATASAPCRALHAGDSPVVSVLQRDAVVLVSVL